MKTEVRSRLGCALLAMAVGGIATAVVLQADQVVASGMTLFFVAVHSLLAWAVFGALAGAVFAEEHVPDRPHLVLPATPSRPVAATTPSPEHVRRVA